MGEVIGLLFGALSLVPFLATLPEQSKVDRTTVVRIGVGTSSSSDASTQGNIPGIGLWDVAGRYISGSYGSDTNIADGGFTDISLTATPDVGGRQGQYLAISAGGNDAICIAYIYMTTPDGTRFTWSGDVGQQCGGFWYESQTIEGNSGYRPMCTWIDGDGQNGTGSNGITTQGFAIHMTDFIATDERAKAYAADYASMCQSWPRFHLYNQMTVNDCIPYFNPPLEYHPVTLVDKDRTKVMVGGSMTTEGCNLPPQPNADAPSYRRGAQPLHLRPSKFRRQDIQGSKFSGKLITSSHPSHSAIGLCDSDMSVGPDFVSHYEGMYCDMEIKQAYPLCNTIQVENCFNLTNTALVPPNGISGRDEMLIPRKEYHTVTHW